MIPNTVTAVVEEITEKAQMLLDIEATEAERLKKTEDDLIHWRENYYFIVKKEQDTKEKLDAANSIIRDKCKQITQHIDTIYKLQQEREELAQEKAAEHVLEKAIQDEFGRSISKLVEIIYKGDLNPTKELKELMLNKPECGTN